MKRRIRLTESDLHNIIKESVKKVLNEGKVSNNVPIYKTYSSEYAQPGDEVTNDSTSYRKDSNYWGKFGCEDFEDCINKYGKDKAYNILLNFRDGADIHDKRRSKYKETGAWRGERYIPQFGRKWENSLYKEKRREDLKELKRFNKMLRLNKITKEEFYNSSKDEQNEYWQTLYNYEWEILDNERQEDAYWRNVMDNAYGPHGW